MNVLLLGVGPHFKNLLRDQPGSHPGSKLEVQSHNLEDKAIPESGYWDVIILGSKVQSQPELASRIKKDRLQGLKIVLTDKNNLRSAMEFWGTDDYSYFLKSMNRELFHLLWQNTVERVELSKKVDRLRQAQKKHRAGDLEQQEVFRDLFTSHLKMQELNQEKTNFLARTSHELLTPLTAVHGYLELVSTGKAGPVNELQARALNASLDSCRRLMRLAHSLTDFIALDRSEAVLQLEESNLQECLYRSVSEIRSNAEARIIDLAVNADPSIPQFRFDRDRMQQVFLNLLDNAIKFTPDGGTIRLCCTPYFWERRTIREMIRNPQDRRGRAASNGFNSVRITVSDTGVGVPPEFLQDIFEEYARVGNDSATPRGFGLGLAIVRRIVLAHEGKIWAESQPGQGSTFTVLIPITA